MRIEGYGRIDRTSPLEFTFDGVAYRGYAGDTLASALLANDVRLVGRSFKYHRPRGIVASGADEPNALVTIRRTPNIRATEQALYSGLEAASQNRWPSLKFDILEANDLLAPFLGAGFYYKTFMWPVKFWERLYEPLIRRAAGLGRLPSDPDFTRNDKAFAHCDVLVIGAGPAGLMAALTAGRAGADVILADADAEIGGRLLAEAEEVGGQPGVAWVAEVAAEIKSLPNVRLMARTTVTGVYDGGTYGALEQVSKHLAAPDPDRPLETFWRISTRRAILAAGAHERMIAFPGNDRPGVMQASAVRAYLHRWGVAPGRRIAVFGNNDEAHRTARDLAAAGVRVAALVDTRANAEAPGDMPFFAGAEITGTRGRLGLTQIRIRTAGTERTLVADALAVAGGWNPAVHLTCHMNGRPVWDDDLQAFLPAPDAVPNLEAAGAAAGAFSTAAALRSGADAGRRAAAALGLSSPEASLPKAADTPYQVAPYWEVAAKGRAWLDLQNDVTTKDIRQAAAENMTSVEHMKRYTTQGMATDQGKGSNVSALAILANATGRSISETGTTTFRPPYTPVSLGAIGAHAQGKGFAPERLTTSHGVCAERGAPMMEAGLWYRPSYFPARHEMTWREACDREVTMVRTHVGIADVSTLGKIDIQGPDAAQFLDFVYANTFSTLKEGRIRYGLMLRDDGHVMDDGTTTRLGPDHFFMTTTTAAAGEVMRHLEFVHQCLRPDWDLSMISVTEQWAQFAIAGPKARAVLGAVLDAPPELPFMGYAPVTMAGVSGRLFRVSFSGEEGYELAVPARYGESLYRLLLAQAETLGGGPYGMEALNVLRIEKGFITHSEIDGRVTPFDLGMAKMVASWKDCIGKAASQRAGLTGPERRQLVGLRPRNRKSRVTAGTLLFDQEAPLVPENTEGHVTSVGYSPTLGHFAALAFLANGRARHGELLRMVDHMRQLETLVEVVSPVFFDPDGSRARG